MDQVSRPFQIALVLTVAIAALWLVALRPQAGEAPPRAPAPPARAPARSAIPGGLGRSVDRARREAARADADAASRPGRVDSAAGDGAAATAPRPGTGPVSPGRLAGGPSPAVVERALGARRAVVLLFYGHGADDRGVSRELRQVGRRGGRVMVLSAPVTRVAAFGAVTRGVRVLESPTVVVVGPSRQARALPGYTDSTEIDQAVQSVLAAR